MASILRHLPYFGGIKRTSWVRQRRQLKLTLIDEGLFNALRVEIFAQSLATEVKDRVTWLLWCRIAVMRGANCLELFAHRILVSSLRFLPLTLVQNCFVEMGKCVLGSLLTDAGSGLLANLTHLRTFFCQGPRGRNSLLAHHTVLLRKILHFYCYLLRFGVLHWKLQLVFGARVECWAQVVLGRLRRDCLHLCAVLLGRGRVHMRLRAERAVLQKRCSYLFNSIHFLEQFN